jgi:hypothetical protein
MSQAPRIGGSEGGAGVEIGVGVGASDGVRAGTADDGDEAVEDGAVDDPVGAGSAQACVPARSPSTTAIEPITGPARSRITFLQCVPACRQVRRSGSPGCAVVRLRRRCLADQECAGLAVEDDELRCGDGRAVRLAVRREHALTLLRRLEHDHPDHAVGPLAAARRDSGVIRCGKDSAGSVRAIRWLRAEGRTWPRVPVS